MVEGKKDKLPKNKNNEGSKARPTPQIKQQYSHDIDNVTNKEKK